jgi:hypothetical protein
MPLRVVAALLLSASCASLPPRPDTVKRYPAIEATQAVAVDRTAFYAIASAAIGKYDKASGRRLGGWTAPAGSAVAHLNSGIIVGGELYCAHSNYPQTPMLSSIEVFDTHDVRHLRTIPLPSGIGSATWVERADDDWLVAFAHYAGRGGEPGKGPEHTRLVRFDRQWTQRASWSFPEDVVSRWQGMSSSGGVLTPGGLLYTTGHHAPELYVLEFPASGSELTLRAIVPIESEGQGIALDRTEGLLYSIQRRTRDVLVFRLPDVE